MEVNVKVILIWKTLLHWVIVIEIVTVTIVQVIVIDETECNVIVIESKVIVLELLLCYYN